LSKLFLRQVAEMLRCVESQAAEFSSLPPFLIGRNMARPKKQASEKYETPARQFGRVSESDWSEIKAACEAAGLSLVAWALPAMLAKARKERRKASEENHAGS